MGGGRSRHVVQWRMLTVFAVLFLLTVAGVAIAFGGNAPLQDSSAVALCWSWYNLVVLGTAIAICFEKPRYRRNERLRGAFPLTVTAGLQSRSYVTADISLSGVRLHGVAEALVGTPVRIQIDEETFYGRIARRSKNDFAVAIEESLQARTAMMRHVYSGRFESTVDRIRSAFVARRLIARIWH